MAHINEDFNIRDNNFMTTFKKYRHNRIMVVDDEEFCISTMEIILEHCGIDIKNRVDYCITGMEALI